MSGLSARAQGYLITFLGVFWLSPEALLLRLVDAPTFDLLAWRNGLAALALSLFVAFRGDVRAKLHGWSSQGWRLLAIAAIYALTSLFFVLAMETGPAADVLVTIGATPLVAAIIGWALLGEVPARNLLVAVLLGALGVGAVGAGSIGGGTTISLVFAALTSLSLALQFTMLRMWPHIDNIAAVIIGSLGLALVSFLIGSPGDVTGEGRLWAIVLGLFLSPVAFTLITFGPRLITGPEVSLLMLLEMVLGPLWVWAVLNEQPGPSAVLGGAIVVLAVLVACSSALKNRGRTKQA